VGCAPYLFGGGAQLFSLGTDGINYEFKSR
jgi:hypothetical protein